MFLKIFYQKSFLFVIINILYFDNKYNTLYKLKIISQLLIKLKIIRDEQVAAKRGTDKKFYIQERRGEIILSLLLSQSAHFNATLTFPSLPPSDNGGHRPRTSNAPPPFSILLAVAGSAAPILSSAVRTEV